MAAKTPFHDYQHAVDFDQRAARSDIRAQLGAWLVEALALKGSEWILDIATGTGRVARPVARHLSGGKIVGVDEAAAMLRVAREQTPKEPIPGYLQTVGVAESLPFRDGVFDRAFVVLSLHHFGDPPLVVQEAFRALRPGGKFAVLDPVLLEARDRLDQSLHDLINTVFRRTHGENFRFHSAEEIRDLLARAGFRIPRADLHTVSFDQESMEGIPTGRHWLEVAEQIQDESPEMRARFEQSYMQYRKVDGKVRVKGRLSFALICGERG
jgi:ubiquinone/menaquinone biosynthesis C-methylase UbiE